MDASEVRARAETLARIDLCATCGPDDLVGVAALLDARDLRTGEVLLRAGDAADRFYVVVSGELRVAVHLGDGGERSAAAGPGAVVGELGLLRGRPRSTTAVAAVPSTVYGGGADAFAALLELPGVHARMRDLVAARLAHSTAPVSTALRDGTAVVLRPLLPRDREEYEARLADLSMRTLVHRFSSAGPPSRRMVEYLLLVDHVDHWAWALLHDPTGRGLGVGRFIRSESGGDAAEIALTVADDAQGRGAGRLLLGAVGAAAVVAGVERFVAVVRSDNRRMRRLLHAAGATFARDSGGQVDAELDPVDVAALLDDDLRARLQAAAADVATAAGLALAGRVA